MKNPNIEIEIEIIKLSNEQIEQEIKQAKKMIEETAEAYINFAKNEYKDNKGTMVFMSIITGFIITWLITDSKISAAIIGIIAGAIAQLIFKDYGKEANIYKQNEILLEMLLEEKKRRTLNFSGK